MIDKRLDAQQVRREAQAVQDARVVSSRVVYSMKFFEPETRNVFIPMPSSQVDVRVLSSWKEIASHLGVGVRTAQVWERERGLPVRRLPGPRGRVYVTVDALDTWRGTAPKTPIPVMRRWDWAVGGLLALTLLVLVLVLRARSVPLRLEGVRTLTTLPGLEVHPHLSPDGTRLAYVRITEEGSVLCVQDIASGNTATIGSVLAASYPRWSPDGTMLTYALPDPDGVRVVVRTFPDGTVRPVALLRGLDRKTDMLSALLMDWRSPEELIVADREPGGPLRLTGIRVADGSRHPLTTPNASPGDVQPASAGTLLAFVRQTSFSEGDVWVRNLSNGKERRLTHDNAKIDGIAWLPDHNSLIIASNRSGNGVSLYHVTTDGRLDRLASGGIITQYPSINANTLVYQNKVRDTNIWAHDSTTHDVGASTAIEHSPSYSPDGTRVAFVSKRTGATEVWMTSTNNTVQLTNLGQTFTDSPRWSRDARRIAFTSQHNGNRDIYVVDVTTKAVRRLTTATSEEGRASFSHDNATLYYRSNRSGTEQLWKQNGDNIPLQITRKGGFEAFESNDGTTLYYMRARNEHDLWQVPVNGGTERRLHTGMTERNWGIAANGIYFLQNNTLRRWDPTTNTEQAAYTIATHKPLEAGISVSTDGQHYLWTQVDHHEADIIRATITNH